MSRLRSSTATKSPNRLVIPASRTATPLTAASARVGRSLICLSSTFILLCPWWPRTGTFPVRAPTPPKSSADGNPRRPVALRVAAGTERLRPEVPGEALEDRLPALLGGPASPPPGVGAEDEARKDAGGGAGERVVAGDLAWPRVALGPAAQASFAPEGSIVDDAALDHGPHRHPLAYRVVRRRQRRVKVDPPSHDGRHRH